jgi:lipopolysaccharide/colanic/teichoic acid biosynthesis glycosyltransferase
MANQHTRRENRGAYKRWFDITVLVVAHLALLPIWLLLWAVIPILIWLGDRGSVFYRQQRVGKDGRLFTLLKFRTMVQHADRKGPAWTTAGDSRVTPVGGLLRKTALDELPEILNIWKGDMSLVGPRALEVKEQQSLEQQIPGFADRLQARPGLTGLAQIYDIKDDAYDKFHYDLEYLQRMSLWLDMRLLLLSVRNTLGFRWDRRSGKAAGTYKTPAAPTTEDGQPGATREGHGHGKGRL